MHSAVRRLESERLSYIRKIILSQFHSRGYNLLNFFVVLKFDSLYIRKMLNVEIVSNFG